MSNDDYDDEDEDDYFRRIMSRTVLSEEQVKQYHEQGYLLVSGLMPPEIAMKAEAAMWQCVGADPQDVTSWANALPNHRAYESAELVACYTTEFLSAAAQLGGEDASIYSAPPRAYLINVFPQSAAWTPPQPHIDHAIKEHGHKTFPCAFRVATMTYLNDVESHGGATFVWRGSHQKIEALARSNPERYEYTWAVNQDLHQLDLGEPVEVTARQGDVLFYH
jgi:hypothetical protein